MPEPVFLGLATETPRAQREKVLGRAKSSDPAMIGVAA